MFFRLRSGIEKWKLKTPLQSLKALKAYLANGKYDTSTNGFYQMACTSLKFELYPNLMYIEQGLQVEQCIFSLTYFEILFLP